MPTWMGLCAVGNGVATRTAPDEALLVKLGSPRPRLVHSGDRMAQQIAAYASLDDDDVRPSSAQNGQRQRYRGPQDKVSRVSRLRSCF